MVKNRNWPWKIDSEGDKGHENVTKVMRRLQRLWENDKGHEKVKKVMRKWQRLWILQRSWKCDKGHEKVTKVIREGDKGHEKVTKVIREGDKRSWEGYRGHERVISHWQLSYPKPSSKHVHFKIFIYSLKMMDFKIIPL